MLFFHKSLGANNAHPGVKFYNFWRNTQIFKMKHKIYEFSLFLKFFCFGSLNIPEYRSLLIGRVLQLHKMEPAVKNIEFTSVIAVCVSLWYCHWDPLYCNCAMYNRHCTLYCPYALYNWHCAMYCTCAFCCNCTMYCVLPLWKCIFYCI